MHESNVAKIGLFALAAFGFVAILGIALTSGTDIEGEDWVVEELVIDAAAVPPLPGTELSAFFDGGELSGAAGCNTYFAGYRLDGSSIAIGPAGSTMAFCSAPEGIMEQEFAYLTLLGAADSFSVDGNRLTLSSGDDVLLRFAIGDAE